MANLVGHDQERAVVHGVENPVIALAHAVEVVLAREFFAALRSRVATECLNPQGDALAVLFEKGLELFAGRGLDLEPIVCLAAGGPSEPPRNQGSAP
jgi:hypothetical protein